MGTAQDNKMRLLVHSEYDGIRSVHESRRPRAFGASLRDSEARRGSPQGRCEEPTSARTETKTETARLPRGNRPYLEGLSRFSHLAGDFGESQPLADDLRYRQVESVTVSHFAFFGCAIVVAECLFIQVTEQVERFDADIGSFESALEKGPEVLKAVGVNLAITYAPRGLRSRVRSAQAIPCRT